MDIKSIFILFHNLFNIILDKFHIIFYLLGYICNSLHNDHDMNKIIGNKTIHFLYKCFICYYKHSQSPQIETHLKIPNILLAMHK